MKKNYRPLSNQEKAALRLILSPNFRHAEKIRAQLTELSLCVVDEVLFYLLPKGCSNERPCRSFGLPVECTYTDDDNQMVYIDLFVDQDNNLSELEIWKPEGSSVTTYFANADLSIRVIDE